MQNGIQEGQAIHYATFESDADEVFLYVFHSDTRIGSDVRCLTD